MGNESSHIDSGLALKKEHIGFFAVIYMVAIHYPLGIDMGGLLLWIELLAIPLCGLLAVLNVIYKRPIVLKGNRIYYIAVLVLVLWAFVSWFKFPIYGSGSSVGGSGDVGIKSYFRIVVGVALFFTSLWYTRYHLKNEFYIYLKILLYFSLLIGVIRLLGFFMGFDIPFMYGVFRYNLEASSAFGGTTLRLSGLDIAGYCGAFSLLALRQSKHGIRTFWFVVLLLIFTVFIFLHAGRTTALCYLLALFYYGVFIEGVSMKKILSAVAVVILLVISLQFLPEDIFRGQLNRMTALSGGVQGQYASRRGYVFATFVEEFLDHPIFGRGIRPVTIGRADRNTNFIQMQLSDGGHGSYYSMLGLFGLGGIFFLGVFLFLTLAKTHLILVRNKGPNREIIVFIALFLVYKLLAYYTSGKGYNDYSLYLLVGIFVGLQEKKYAIIKKTGT
jgi:hypothetical protein